LNTVDLGIKNPHRVTESNLGVISAR